MKNTFGSEKEIIKGVEWDWKNFKSTEGFPVSEDLLEWVIGQDKALEECYLCLDEWTHKLKWMQKEDWYKAWEDPNTEKPNAKKFIPAGPYLLLLGDAGTGKSLIGRALASKLTELYKKHGIVLRDVLCWANNTIPSEPKISIHKANEGKKLVRKEKMKYNKQKAAMGGFIKFLTYFLAAVGILFITIGCFLMWNAYTSWLDNINGVQIQFQGDFMKYFMYSFIDIGSMTFLPAGIMLIFLVLILVLGRFGMGGGATQGISGTQKSDAPKLIVDNSGKSAPFIDATGHKSAQLFGSIAWDPFQGYSLDTLILTPNGWKEITKVEKNTKVLTMNMETNKIENQNVIWTNQYHIDKAVKFKNRHFDLIVDQDHAIYNAKNKERERAGNYIDREVTFTRLGDWEGKIIPMSDTFLKFVAWYITEGSSFMDSAHRRIKICQVTDQTKVTRIMDIVRDLDMKYSYDGKDIRIHHAPQEIFEYVQNCGKSALTKRIPQEIKNASKQQINIFFNELLMGDGQRCKDKIGQYWTSSWRLCSDFQEIALKLGYGTTVWTDKRKTNFASIEKNPNYCITIVKGGTFPVKGKLINYNNEVRCIGVPNQIIFVMRNGKPLWCGNTGGLGTPEHQRTTAGDCHKANLGILYIDEIKNLHPEEAVTLLTVLEEGQLAITLRSRWSAGGTSAMAVSTEPVPCLTFLVGAGNFDSIQMIHPALMDRIYGYGKVVRMNNDMPNTIKNRRKYVQFIAQESKRFRFPPFSREACIELISEGRRRCGKRNRLATKFRPLIAIIKTASTLALNDKSKLVERKYVVDAIENHCKTIQKQLLEHNIEERGELLEIHPEGKQIGSIYGLAVVMDKYSHEMTGTVLQVKGCLENKIKKKNEGYLDVTGVVKSDASTWIEDSISKVRMVIIQKYGIDIAQNYFTHIDFAQAFGVDGPSAGVTMTLLLCSLIEKKAIRQDVAVTGEVNIAIDGKIRITAIGGVHEKIKAAEAWGFKKVVIPKRNFEKSIDPKDYTIEVVGAETLEEYLKEVLA